MAAPSARVGMRTPAAFDAAAAPAIRLLSTHANLNHSPGCQYAALMFMVKPSSSFQSTPVVNSQPRLLSGIFGALVPIPAGAF